MATIHEIICKMHSRQLLRNELSQESVAGVAGYIFDIIGDLGKTIWEKTSAPIKPENSLSEFTRTTNIEPRVMIEDSLVSLPNMKSTMMFLTNLYAAYYLQAVTISSAVGKVSVVGVLDKFNPHRNPYDSLVGSANESYMEVGYVLPNYKKPVTMKQAARYAKLALEADIVKAEGESEGAGAPDGNTDANNSGNKNAEHQVNTPVKYDSKSIKENLKMINDANNLAVGRLINVDVMLDANAVISVPVSIRMRPMSVPKLIMNELVSLGDVRQSYTERWHKWRSGEISAMDWIFMLDIIEHRRKLMALDKQGLYKEILKRRADNKVASAASGKASIGAASAFIIITKNTADQVEARMGTSLDNDSFRDRVFAENSAMMILVFDQEWERVTAYTRGIKGSANYSYKDIENLSKGDGPNITEIMKAYTEQKTPRF